MYTTSPSSLVTVTVLVVTESLAVVSRSYAPSPVITACCSDATAFILNLVVSTGTDTSYVILIPPVSSGVNVFGTNGLVPKLPITLLSSSVTCKFDNVATFDLVRVILNV